MRFHSIPEGRLGRSHSDFVIQKVPTKTLVPSAHQARSTTNDRLRFHERSKVSCKDIDRRRLSDPDGYRPEICAKCDWDVLHVHDHPTRKPPEYGEISIVRHRCVNPKCGATWRILPAFLARHLHRAWRTIERTVDEDKPVQALDIPRQP